MVHSLLNSSLNYEENKNLLDSDKKYSASVFDDVDVKLHNTDIILPEISIGQKQVLGSSSDGDGNIIFFPI